MADLPKPAAWEAYWRGDNDGPSWSQYHDEGDPLPTEWDDPPDEVTPLFTADQLRAYAAAQVAEAVAEERAKWAAEAAGERSKGLTNAEKPTPEQQRGSRGAERHEH